MIDVQEFLWGFSIISLLLYFLQGLRKSISMALSVDSPPPAPPPPPPPLSWVGRLFVSRGGGYMVSNNRTTENLNRRTFAHEEYPRKRLHGMNMMCREKNIMQEDIRWEVQEKGLHDHNSCILTADTMCKEGNMMQENQSHKAHEKGFHDKYLQENPGIFLTEEGSDSLVKLPQEKSAGILMTEGSDSLGVMEVGGDKGSGMLRKRPGRLVVPQYCPGLGFGDQMGRSFENKEFEVEGRDFFLASKKGRRDTMEDGYGVMIDILGDPKQAFFAVIDGHGGCAATDYVAKNLGKNIVKELENVGKADDQLEQAIRRGYSVTDKEFLSQGASGGACASSVLLKDGELHVANVGDCRVVLSRKGVANTLTNDHRLSKEDERVRIESSGGFVQCRNGVWRIHGSLAVSRAIGDLHLKKWVISEPEIKKLPLTSDCEFLIMASDGLWDKVNDQEAVDVVLREKNSAESCKKLVDLSFSRGNMDDITVMVINLQKFVMNVHE